MYEFQVDGMNCGSCVKKIVGAVNRLDPVATVDVDRASARVRVHSRVDADDVAAAILGVGFVVRRVNS